MKNSTQDSTNHQVVKASITTNQKQGFYNFANANTTVNVKDWLLLGFTFMLVLLLLSFNIAIAQTVLKGGGQWVQPNPTGGANNETEVELINNTGHDIWDLKITTSNGKIKTYDINTAGGNLDKGTLNPKSASVHSKFKKAVKATKPPGRFKVKITATAPVDSILITPTDTLGADMLINRSLPGNEFGNKNETNPKSTELKGGAQTVTFDASNFASLDYTNKAGKDICDLNIKDAKDANGGAVKIDSVLVNYKKVYGAPPSAASVHVVFPCVKDGDSFTVTVKFAGTKKAVTYTVLPTDSLSHELVCEPIKLGLPDLINSQIPVATTVSFAPGVTSNKPSVAITNLTGQEICGFIVSCSQSINKIYVNNSEWSTSPVNTHGKKIQVFAGNNSCIANDSTFNFDLSLVSPTAKISSINIIPINGNGKQIIKANVTGGSSSFLMPNENSSFGTTGRSGSLVAINESCSPISQLVFTSPNAGVAVIDTYSPYTSVFDSILHTLTFNPPVASGDSIKFDFTINTLLPYSPTDSFPYTTIDFFYPGSQPFDGWWWSVPSSCPSASNGSVDFTVTGGTSPFSFLWSNGSTEEDLNGISAGAYTVTVSSPAGCMTKKIDVEAKQPNIEIIPVNLWCNGANDGSAIAIPEGLDGNLNFLWSNGSTERIINNLNIGNYTVTVSNGFGCTLTTTITISQPAPVSVTGTTVKLNCNMDHSGSISIFPAGGTEDYNFKWNGGSTNQNRTGLNSGTYSVTVTDGYGCSTTASFKVKQPTALAVNTTGTDVQCGGSTGTGSAIAAVTGGTMPYNFMWSNGMTTAVVNGLLPGTYNVMVTDAKGCIGGSTVNINIPPPMQVNVQVMPPSQAMANVFGGVPPYTYMWNTIPVQTTQFAMGLMPNQTYMLMVHDAHNCMQTVNFFMPANRIGDKENSYNVTALPNPTSGLLNISIANVEDGKCEITLMDATSRSVFTKQVELINSSFALDLSKHTNGVYSLKIVNGNETKLIKVVIQK